MSKRPVVLVVMDGVGIRESDFGNAVSNAYKPTLDNLWNNCPHTEIKAHGVAVGLPSDGDMGNSEVGHNALGCGQIYSQGAKLVNESIESGDMFTTETWKELVDKCKDHGTMHFLGLLSDGNVHSHIDHLKALITRAKEDGVKEVRLHVLLDGRDVPETSALIYVDEMRAVADHLHIATDDGSAGAKGMVTDVIRDLVETRGEHYDECVAIGPMIMMKFVALTTRPYALKTTVSLNALMVDGTGMCGACRVTVGGRTYFTCVDGPEFDGHAVDFDEAMRRQGMYRTQEERARAIAAERAAGHQCRIGLDK